MADRSSRPVRTMSLMCRAPGLTFEEFETHWRTVHADMVREIPGITRYVQRHVVRAEGEEENEFGVDGFAILEYESLEAMEAAWASPAGRAALDDVKNFRGRGALIHFVDEVVFDHDAD